MESRGALPDKRLFLLLPTAFTMSLAIGVVNLGMLFLVKGTHGAGPETIGWFTALWCVTYFSGCLLLRPVSRLLRASASMVLACALITVLLAVYALTPSLISAFISYGLYGFACALFWPRAMGWLAAGLEGTGITRAYGAYNIAWSTAGILAPYIAGALSELNPPLPVYVGIALFAANCFFVLLASPRIPSPSLPAEGAETTSTTGAEDHSTPLRFPAWIGVFAAYVLFAVFSNIFPVFAKDELFLSESAIGLILLARASVTAAAFWLIGRSSAWQFKRKLLIMPLCAGFALDLVFIFVRSTVGFLIGISLSGIVIAFAYSMSVFYGASGAADRDKRMSIHEAVLTAGQVVGSVAGGALYQRFSWSSIFALTAILFALCIAGQLRLLRKA